MDKNRQRNRVLKRRKLAKERKNIYALPSYKAAYDCYKECRFRFRTVNKDCRAIAHEVLQNLLNIMVDIELAYWQVKSKSILTDTYRNVLKTTIIIRSMHDMGELSTHHYSIISQYTSALSKQMGNWNKFYNKKLDKNEIEETEDVSAIFLQDDDTVEKDEDRDDAYNCNGDRRNAVDS